MDKMLLKFICLILAPMALISIELFHPSGYAKAVYQNLLPHARWWIQLHVLQPLFFSLVGLGGIILTWNSKRLLSYVSKISLFLFIVYYTVYDSVAGIGTGILIDVVMNMPADSKIVGIDIIQTYFHHPYLGGTHSWLSEFASMTWLVGMWSAAIILYIEKRPLPPLFLLGLSGVFIWYNHGFPTGPLGFACFLIGGVWLEYGTPKRVMPKLKD